MSRLWAASFPQANHMSPKPLNNKQSHRQTCLSRSAWNGKINNQEWIAKRLHVPAKFSVRFAVASVAAVSTNGKGTQRRTWTVHGVLWVAGLEPSQPRSSNNWSSKQWLSLIPVPLIKRQYIYPKHATMDHTHCFPWRENHSHQEKNAPVRALFVWPWARILMEKNVQKLSLMFFEYVFSCIDNVKCTIYI